MRVPPLHAAIRVIHDEHDHLAAVIHGMLYFARTVAKGGTPPDFKVFRAMLLYISDYPEQVHHPKEDDFLFARLRARTDRLNEVLETLEAQHATGDALVCGLERALTRFELQGGAAGARFAELVEQYASFYFTHMRLEEEQVMPAAQELLTDDDWQQINAAFAANNDPLQNGEYKQGLDELFSLIVKIAPPPIGVGPAD